MNSSNFGSLTTPQGGLRQMSGTHGVGQRSNLHQYAGGGVVRNLKGGLSQFERAMAELIGTRAATQVESYSGPLGLTGVNLPAAFAGDQRSLQAAQKQMQRQANLAETGLESPGRRKILKQGAASALRNMVPDGVASTLMDLAKPAEALRPAIPDASYQAAITAALNKALAQPLLHGGEMWEFPSVAPYLRDHLNGRNWDAHPAPDWVEPKSGRAYPVRPQDHMYMLDDVHDSGKHELADLWDSLHPEAIAKNHGLPPEGMQEFMKKQVTTPHDVLGDWLNADNSMDSYFGSNGGGDLFHYLGFDEMPKGIDPKAFESAVSGHLGGDEEALMDLYNAHHDMRLNGPHESLLGKDGVGVLRANHEGSSFGYSPRMVNDSILDYINEFHGDDVSQVLDYTVEGIKNRIPGGGSNVK